VLSVEEPVIRQAFRDRFGVVVVECSFLEVLTLCEKLVVFFHVLSNQILEVLRVKQGENFVVEYLVVVDFSKGPIFLGFQLVLDAQEGFIELRLASRERTSDFGGNVLLRLGLFLEGLEECLLRLVDIDVQLYVFLTELGSTSSVLVFSVCPKTSSYGRMTSTVSLGSCAPVSSMMLLVHPLLGKIRFFDCLPSAKSLKVCAKDDFIEPFGA
jgi:hypothetical protein